jgi:hypothetical protein
MKEGRQIEACTIRKGDELQELCALLNDVTAPLRAKAARESFGKKTDLESVSAPIPSTAQAAKAKEQDPKPSPDKAKTEEKAGKASAE